MSEKLTLVKIINQCPDCNGTGKVVKSWRYPNVLRDCPTCGNEPDDTTLVKRRGYWYKANDNRLAQLKEVNVLCERERKEAKCINSEQELGYESWL